MLAQGNPPPGQSHRDRRNPRSYSKGIQYRCAICLVVDVCRHEMPDAVADTDSIVAVNDAEKYLTDRDDGAFRMN